MNMPYNSKDLSDLALLAQNQRNKVLLVCSYFSIKKSILSYFCQENDSLPVILGHVSGNGCKKDLL